MTRRPGRLDKRQFSRFWRDSFRGPEGMNPWMSIRTEECSIEYKSFTKVLMDESPELIDSLRQRINEYHKSMRWDSKKGKHRDPFIDWYQNWAPNNNGDLQLRILVILVNARFDQGTRAERALENTQRVLHAGILTASQPELHDVPALNTRQRMKPERWRELFWLSLPGLKQLASEIAGRRRWRAKDFLGAIITARIPWFGHKTARLAVRWISEIVSDIEVDMADSEVPVDSLVFRVAARLGLLDPDRERYWGPRSPGHEAIQAVARKLFPHNPSLMDEPIWMMGRRRGDGGFCSPTEPNCDQGCLFSSFCPRLSPQDDPVSIGYSVPTPRRTSKTPIIGCPGPRRVAIPTAPASPAPARAVDNLLVIVSCVQKKIWDVDDSALPAVPAGEAYVSSYFIKNRAYAQTFGEAWCILSAKYGFVLPEDAIEKYNVTFKERSSEVVTLSKLKEQIVSKRLNRFGAVQVLGGRDYVARIESAFAGTGLEIKAPLAGLRIGEAMREVQDAVNSRFPFYAKSLVR